VFASSRNLIATRVLAPLSAKELFPEVVREGSLDLAVYRFTKVPHVSKSRIDFPRGENGL